jgi:hypothetical protein
LPFGAKALFLLPGLQAIGVRGIIAIQPVGRQRSETKEINPAVEFYIRIETVARYSTICIHPVSREHFDIQQV